MALLQNPRQQRMFASPGDGGGDLPVIPSAVRPDQQPQAFQGARQLGAFLARQPDPWARAPAQPVTDATPRAVLQRKWDNAAFNFKPNTSVDGNGNASWASEPFGQPTLRTRQRQNPAGLLRPASGPGSADWNAVAQSAPAVAVSDIPVAATLIRPDGTSATIAPARAAVPSAQPRSGSPTPAEAPAQTGQTRAAPGIDSGVTVGGRQLNYGAMVGGMPTFSDGSGGPNGALGTIPRTVSDATLSRLAAAPSVGRADAGALAIPLASDVLGATPTQEQMVQQRVNAAQLSRPVTGSRPSDAQFAASDLAAIASGDPRSALGTAASNLRVDAAYGRTPRLRRVAEGQLAALTAGVQQLGQQQVQGDQQQEIVDQQGRNELQKTALAGQYGVAEQQAAQLRRPRQQVTLGDGTIGLLDQTNGTVTPATMADGSPAKGPITREDAGTKRTQELIDQLNKGVQEQLKNYVPTANAPEPTADMIRGWRAQQALAMNLPVATNPKTGERVVNINGQWTRL